jgi:hypothetical protein
MRALALAALAAVALVAVYLALGGASYAPAKVADPCVQRETRSSHGVEQAAQQIVLSALDGAACKLGVSREEMVLAFGSRDSLEQFARAHGISEQRLDRLVRAGLIRAIEDAERAGEISGTTAELVRSVVERIPVSELLDLLGHFPGL